MWSGIFSVYVLHAWASGTMLDASNAKEVLVPKQGDKSDRPSQFEIHPIKEKCITMSFKARTDLIQQNNNQRMTMKPEMTFELYPEVTFDRHHVHPSAKPCAERRSFSIPLEFVFGAKRASIAFDVFGEARIGGQWNGGGCWELLLPWIGFTQFLMFKEKRLDGYRQTYMPDFPGFRVRSSMSRSLQVVDKLELDNTRKLRGFFCIEARKDKAVTGTQAKSRSKGKFVSVERKQGHCHQ